MKLKDIYYALLGYAMHTLFGEHRHAAKCLSDFRRCATTASIGELGTLTIGEYDRLRTLLTDARRDFAEIGDLPSEIAERRERHDAELRRLMDATARDAETAEQAATKANAVENALLGLIYAVKLEMDFINHSAARLSVARTAKRIDGEYQTEWNAWGYLSRYAENLPTGAELARRCLTLRGICAEHDIDAAHDAVFRECLSNWKANGTADFKMLIPLLRKADGGKGRGELAHDVQGYQAALDAAIRDAADATKRGDWDAFQDAVNAYCREATADHTLLALEVRDWERELNARLASAWEVADAAASGMAATAAAAAPQGGAQVAPQIATQGKKPHFNMGVGAVELYKAGMEWLERPNNQGKSADDAVRWLVSDACINHRKFRVRVLMKGRKWPDKETEGVYADTVNWDRHGLDVERWGGYLGNYMKWRKDEKAHKALANQSGAALPPPPLQIENKSPIRNKKALKRVGKRRGK